MERTIAARTVGWRNAASRVKALSMNTAAPTDSQRYYVWAGRLAPYIKAVEWK